MKKRLMKDIVIPAGTIFKDAPVKTQRAKGEFMECIIGLSRNTAGSLVYEAQHKELSEWFEDVS